jgi:hypothetical protein
MAYHTKLPIVTDGLVFSVDPYNTKSYVSGDTITYDLTKNNNDGTLNNVSFSGKSFLIDKTSTDYIDFGDVDIFKSSPVSVDFWINLTSFGNLNPFGTRAGRIITTFKNLQSSGLDIFALDTDGSPTFNPLNCLAMKINGGTNNNIGTLTTVDLGQWNHFTLTYESGTGTNFYKNGVFTELVSTITSSVTTNTYPLTIGDWADQDGGRTMDGLIGSIKIYNRVLTADEVLQNHNALKGRFV